MALSPPLLVTPQTFYVTPAGGTVTVPTGKDAIIVLPTDASLDRPLTIKGGRSKKIVGGIMAGRTSTSGFSDSGNRGIRLSDGDTGPWTFWLEGIWSKAGTYLSDWLQCGVRSNNSVTVKIKNCRVDSTTWGQQSAVHADTIQIWGGVLNMHIENFVATNIGYQGYYWDSADGRSLPTGPGKVPWTLENVYLKGVAGQSSAFKYLYANREASWAAVQATNFYVSPGGNNVKDSFGQAPASTIIGTPSTDFCPTTRWSGFTYLGAGAGPSGGGETPVPVPPQPSYAYRNGKRVLQTDMVLNKASDSAWNLSLKLKESYPTYWNTTPVDYYSLSLQTALSQWQQDVMGWSGPGADGFAGPNTCAQLGLVWVPYVAPSTVYASLVAGGMSTGNADTALDAAAAAVADSSDLIEAEGRLLAR